MQSIDRYNRYDVYHIDRKYTLLKCTYGNERFNHMSILLSKTQLLASLRITDREPDLVVSPIGNFQFKREPTGTSSLVITGKTSFVWTAVTLESPSGGTAEGIADVLIEDFILHDTHIHYPGIITHCSTENLQELIDALSDSATAVGRLRCYVHPKGVVCVNSTPEEVRENIWNISAAPFLSHPPAHPRKCRVAQDMGTQIQVLFEDTAQPL